MTGARLPGDASRGAGRGADPRAHRGANRGASRVARRVVGFAGWIALVGCGALPAAESTTARAVPVLARLDTVCPAADVAPRDATAGLSITAWTSAADWRRHLAGLRLSDPDGQAATLARWRIAFGDGESVVRVDAGPRPNPGWRIAIGEPAARLDGDRLLIRAAVARPPAGSIQAQVIVRPCSYLQLGHAAYRVVAVPD